MKENFVLIAGIVILVFLLINYRKSTYTIQSFSDMTDAAAVQQNFKVQVATIVAEMTSAMKDANTAKKTVDERIAIANTYNDQLHQLNKNFSEWSVRQGTI